MQVVDADLTQRVLAGAMALPNQPRADTSDPPPPLELTEPHAPKARLALVQRLCEIVSWPETRLPSYERQLAADILVGLLRTTNVDLRRRCAHGLIRVQDAPKALLRYLARDEISVARKSSRCPKPAG